MTAEACVIAYPYVDWTALKCKLEEGEGNRWGKLHDKILSKK
jgi:hypothetical protein